jgi:hypothetical protein
MNIKITSISAAVAGVLCVAYAAWWQYAALSVIAVVPGMAVSLDERHFWWPLWTGFGLLTLSSFGFIWHRRIAMTNR